MEDRLTTLESDMQSNSHTAPRFSSDIETMLFDQMQAHINSLEAVVKYQDATIKSQQELLHKTVAQPPAVVSTTHNQNPQPKQQVPAKKTNPSAEHSTMENISRERTERSEFESNSPTNDTSAASMSRRNKMLKPHVALVGDSMLGGLEHLNKDTPLSRSHFTTVKAHGGATSEDILDFVRPVLRRKPNKLIVHCGSNDFKNKLDTAKNIERFLTYSKQNNPDVELAVSEICIRKDKDAPPTAELVSMNKRIKEVCDHQLVQFISQSNFNENCLSKRQLHPNRYGNECLKKAFVSVFPQATGSPE